MTDLFLKLLNMSIAASWLVLAVMLLRLLLKKAPKWISCLLWGIVALRLVMPFSLESIFSLIPSAEVIPQDIAVSQTPAIYSGIPAVNSAINPLLTSHLTPGESMLEKGLLIVTAVWIAGVVVLVLYSAVTYWKLRHQVQASLLHKKNIYICDDIKSPFILGIFCPRIYIPSGMDAEQLQYVFAHENAHIKRRDHWWKPLGFMLLTVYWFNPLLWLAYILLCRDIERACDEKVIAEMDSAGKKGYSEALVACSVHRRMIMACPVAFGEVGVKERIKGIIRYKKPAFWIVLVSVAACTVTAVCFLTNPVPCRHEYRGEITVNSTCTQKGVETLTCQLCEHSYTAPAELLAHNYDEGAVVIEPNCIHLGSRERKCTGCGAVKTETIEQTGHVHGVPFLSKGPNCAEAGEKSAECTVCHAVHVVETIEPNRVHDLQETVLLEATCAAPGEGILTCTRCDYSASCTYQQLEHTVKNGITFQATCVSEARGQRVCTVCGVEWWVTLDEGSGETGHYWRSSMGPGYPTRCLYCGMLKSDSKPEIPSDFSLLESPSFEEDMFPVIRIWP